MAEVMANNDWRDFPFVQWTLKLYTDGITYDTLGDAGEAQATASQLG